MYALEICFASLSQQHLAGIADDQVGEMRHTYQRFMVSMEIHQVSDVSDKQKGHGCGLLRENFMEAMELEPGIKHWLKFR